MRKIEEKNGTADRLRELAGMGVSPKGVPMPEVRSGSVWSSLIVGPRGAGETTIFTVPRGQSMVSICGSGEKWREPGSGRPLEPQVDAELLMQPVPIPSEPRLPRGRLGKLASLAQTFLGVSSISERLDLLQDRLSSLSVRVISKTQAARPRRSVADVFTKYSEFTTNITQAGMLGHSLGDATIHRLRWQFVADDASDLAQVCGRMFYKLIVGGRILDGGSVGEDKTYDVPIQCARTDTLEMRIGVDGFATADTVGSILVKAIFDCKFLSSVQ